MEGVVEDAILEEVLDNEVTADGENVGDAIDSIIQGGAEEVTQWHYNSRRGS